MTLALYLSFLIGLSLLVTSYRFVRHSPGAPSWITALPVSRWGEIFQYTGLFAASCFCIITFVMQVMYIPSSSMEPGLKVGDKVLVKPASFGFINPFTGDHITEGDFKNLNRGDVVIAKFAYSADVRYIKRVIGLPGDRVFVSEEGISINGNLSHFQKTDNPQIYNVKLDRSNFKVKIAGFENFHVQQEVTIPSGHVFLLGDNLTKSSDSRDLGFIPLKSIIARPY